MIYFLSENVLIIFYLFRIPTEQDIKRRMNLPITYTSTKELRIRAAQIMTRARISPAVEEDSILVPRTDINMWGKNRPFSKANLMNKFCGYEPVINRGKDEKCMTDYLKVTE